MMFLVWVFVICGSGSYIFRNEPGPFAFIYGFTSGAVTAILYRLACDLREIKGSKRRSP